MENQAPVPIPRPRNGRPPKKKADRKDTNLVLRLTESDQERITAAFDNSTYANRSQMVYDMLFHRQLYQKDANTVEIYNLMQDMVKEIKAIGVNYNQLVKKVHTLTSSQLIASELSKAISMQVEIKATEQKIFSEITKLSDKWSQELPQEKTL
jgi:DNA-binding FadR family transcriptional regulator